MITLRQASSDEDRLAVLRIGHAAFDGERPFLERAALRIVQRRRSLAHWWLLLEGGEPVASLIDYPLMFGVRGTRRPGTGLGLVGTLPTHRGRGHATALCAAALDAAEREGRDVGLLFSGIAPAFYERLGFVALPAEGARCESPAAIAGGPDLLPLDPWRHRDRLVAVYEAFHGDALHLHRDAARWEASLIHGSDDVFLTDGPDAYVRLTLEPDEVEVVELIAPPERREGLWRAVAGLAGQRPLTGWIAPPESLAGAFTPTDRDHTRPMVRGRVPTDGARFWSSDHF